MQNPSGPAPPKPFKSHPRRRLLEYQRRWVEDKSRWKFGLMSRQVGKDFSAAYEGVEDCLIHDVAGKKTDWLIVAPSERQSLESLNKWKAWAEAFKILTAGWEERRESAGRASFNPPPSPFPTAAGSSPCRASPTRCGATAPMCS